MKNSIAKLMFGFMACASLGGHAVAQQESGYRLEEIVVTATRREERLQDVPMSVTALSEETISAQGLNAAADWVRAVPGLSYSSVSAGQRNGLNFVIRGVSNTRIFDSGTSATTTGYQVDDVAIQPVDAKLFDVDRIEVLKGPQGTLFGQASMGGTIRIFTNEPDAQEFSAKARTSLSNTKGGDESYTGDLMVNIPVVENVLGVRGVISHENLGGWIDRIPASLDVATYPKDLGAEPIRNRATASNLQENWNNSEARTYRLSAKYSPNDTLSITPRVTYQTREASADDTYHRNLADSLGMVTHKFRETPRAEDFVASSLNIGYDMGLGTLTSISAWTRREFTATQDLTYGDATRVGFNQDGSIPATNAFDFSSEVIAFSQELRFGSQIELRGSSIDYVLGGFYQREETDLQIVWHARDWNRNADNDNFITHPEGLFLELQRDSDYEVYSLFGDATVRFGKVALTGGLRWWDQQRWDGPDISRGTAVGATFTDPDVAVHGPRNGVREKGVTPRASISYDLQDNHLAYFTYSQGFRIGGFESIDPTPECDRALAAAGLPPASEITDFKSDEISNYELGLKTTWLQGAVQANMSAFKIDWTDLQQALVLNQLDIGCASAITQNIGAVDIEGFELEFHTAHDRLAAGGAVSYTDAEVSDAPAGATFAVGDPVGGTPKWTASAYLQYGFPLAFSDAAGYVRADWSYRDSMIGPTFVDHTDPFYQNDSYYILNLSATASSEKFGSITLFVNNVTDQVGDLGSSVQFGEPFTNDVITIRPRTIGLRYTKVWR